jgi:hypothetical protein
MDILYRLLLVVHILAAATWFGGGLGLSARVRRSIELGSAAAEALAEELRKQRIIAVSAALLVLFTGVGLIFVVGGFSVVPLGIQVALGLMLLALLVELGLIQPATRRISVAIDKGGDLTHAAQLARRLAPASGIIHLLWTAMLVLMIWKSF